ncbi:DUF6907 domain-containing protein [Nocardioides immobilis]|nr:hypothetical protein [Nocardioides immobilis]
MNTTLTTHITCPDWCEYPGVAEEHDLDTYQDGTVRFTHIINFGRKVWGAEEVNAVTGARVELEVRIIDVEAGGPGVEHTPASLRELAGQFAAAAEWLEAHR